MRVLNELNSFIFVCVCTKKYGGGTTSEEKTGTERLDIKFMSERPMQDGHEADGGQNGKGGGWGKKRLQSETVNKKRELSLSNKQNARESGALPKKNDLRTRLPST